MPLLRYRVSSFAAVLLLAGSSVFAQTNTTVLSEKGQKLQTENITTYVPEDIYALPWVPIPESNIAWKKRVWRNIDTRDVQNKIFSNDAVGKPNSTFVDILLDGVFSGKIKAYSAATDRFNTILSKEDMEALITPGKGGVNPHQVIKYQLKEDWLFLKDQNKLVVRIVGIAPVREVTGADGKVTDKPMFWIYYPDNRDYMAAHTVNGSKETSWDQVFEGRGFVSDIVKVSSPAGPVVYNK